MKLRLHLLVATVCGLSAVSSQAITMFGLGTDGTLFSFDTETPSAFTTVGTPGFGIVDIDFRGSNGQLYGINAAGTSYTIDLSSGLATLAFTPSTLNGSVSGFDVNPAADRFRVTTDAAADNNNYRLSSSGNDDGTTTPDGRFDTPSNAADTAILDVAYRNPFNGAAGTALYSVGADGNLFIHDNQDGDDPGTFNARESLGSLGIPNLAADIAFDIAQDGNGYIASGNSLYRVEGIGTQAQPLAELIGTLDQEIVSFSAVPEPSTALLGCLGALALLRRRR